MSPADLQDLHIAALHERAAKLGIAAYRTLRRDDLIEAIQAQGGGEPEPDDEARDDEPVEEAEAGDEPKAERPRRRRGGRGRGRERDRERAPRERAPREREEPPEDEETEQVSGVLDITGQGHGFIRLKGLEREEDDVYVSSSQIRRCELRAGDEVSGPARAPRRGERHRALVHVDTVNGTEPQAEKPEDRPSIDALKPVAPSRRLPLGDADPLVRAADRLAPLAFGQRVLVDAAPRSGRTTLLRGIATALAGKDGVEVVVVLVDERPEEATAWREALPDTELAIATADMSPNEQIRIAELGLARAARIAERGGDAVLIVDSLSRVAAAGDAAPAKRIFGSGRELEGDDTGSLTVVATTLEPGDDAHRAVSTTENATIALSAELAGQGIIPIDAAGTRASGEDAILSEDELADLRTLRGELTGLSPAEAAKRVSE